MSTPRPKGDPVRAAARLAETRADLARAEAEVARLRSVERGRAEHLAALTGEPVTPAPRAEQSTLRYGIRARETRRRAGLIPAMLRRPNRKPLP